MLTPRSQLQHDINAEQAERDYRKRQIQFIKELRAIYENLRVQDAIVSNAEGAQMSVLDSYEQTLTEELNQFNRSCIEYHEAEVKRIVGTFGPEVTIEDSVEEKKTTQENELHEVKLSEEQKHIAPQIKHRVNKRFEKLFFLQYIEKQYANFGKEPPLFPKTTISVLLYLFRYKSALLQSRPHSASSSSSSTPEVAASLPTTAASPKFP